jgi:hypothetical protein
LVYQAALDESQFLPAMGAAMRVPAALTQPAGAILTESQLLGRRQLLRGAIYNDLLLPADTPYFMFAWLQKDSQVIETLALEGSARHGAFDADAIALNQPSLLKHDAIQD